ncbi:MAG: hypothetical protein ABJA78_02140 [Ferruginibacter sp.]
MNNNRENILKTLAYFNIFRYPLTKEEICNFHGLTVADEEIQQALFSLVADRSIFMIDEFYSLQNDVSLAARRRDGNLRAVEQMKKANRAARILSKFPYVKGLAISGSLSKNYADEKTDIDFFIITSANRLWIARTFMHLYKKFTFLTGRQHWFCMNYYVDESNLQINEKNIFTAMEIITLIPMYGADVLEDFMQANHWAFDFFPRFTALPKEMPPAGNNFLKRMLEKIFAGRFGNSTDNRLMKITDIRWKKKTRLQKRTEKGTVISMAVGKHYSKPNPRNFQEKVIEKYQSKVNTLFLLQAELQH